MKPSTHIFAAAGSVSLILALAFSARGAFGVVHDTLRREMLAGRSYRNGPWGALTMGLSLITACNRGLSDDAKSALLSNVDAALEAAADSDRARKAAVEALVEAPEISAQPCTQQVLKTGHGLEEGTYRNNAAFIVRGAPLNVVFDEPGQALKPGWRLTKLTDEVARLRRQISGRVEAGEEAIGGEQEAWAKSRIATLADEAKVGRYELGALTTVLATVDFEGKSFPSRVAVRVYAWDHKDRKIVCQAEAIEDLEGEVEVSYRKHEGMQDRDVEAALQRTALDEGLRKACGAMGVGAEAGR